MLVETKTRKPGIITEFLIYRNKEKYLLKQHSEDFYGLYEKEILDGQSKEEIDLKIFLGKNPEEALKEMEEISKKAFSVLQKILGEELAELELEFSFERTSYFEKCFKVVKHEVLISNFDITLLNKQDVSHKKGKTLKRMKDLTKIF